MRESCFIRAQSDFLWLTSFRYFLLYFLSILLNFNSRPFVFVAFSLLYSPPISTWLPRFYLRPIFGLFRSSIYIYISMSQTPFDIIHFHSQMIIFPWNRQQWSDSVFVWLRLIFYAFIPNIYPLSMSTKNYKRQIEYMHTNTAGDVANHRQAQHSVNTTSTMTSIVNGIVFGSALSINSANHHSLFFHLNIVSPQYDFCPENVLLKQLFDFSSIKEPLLILCRGRGSSTFNCLALQMQNSRCSWSHSAPSCNLLCPFRWW